MSSDKEPLQAHMLEIHVKKTLHQESWHGWITDKHNTTVWICNKESAQEAFTTCLERLNKAVEESRGNGNG